MSTNVAFSSSVSKDARSIPAAANAASVGANTVKGPSACNADTKSAAVKAATKEVWIPVDVAVAGISTKSAGGISTVSITWITPLDAGTSAKATVAPDTVTASAETVKDNASPFNAVAVIPSVRSVDKTCPDTTW